MLCLTVLLSLSAIYVLIRLSVIKPIRDISDAMTQVADGRYGQSIPVKGDHELSVMARQFNLMSQEIRASHQGISQERNKLTTIIHSAREAIVVTNDQDEVVLVNPSAERLLGKTTAQIIEEGFFQLVDDVPYMRASLSSQGTHLPETLVYNNRILSIYTATISNTRGTKVGSAALIRDITAEKKMEDQLRQLSYTDILTGLYNRRWLDQTLAKEFARAQRYQTGLSVIFFDVDHFKRLNDTYGHDVGDRVLSELGALSRRCFRHLDFPCRYGGEEFCVILSNTCADGAFRAAEVFRQQVADMVVADMVVDGGVRVTISAGVASYPEAFVNTAEALLKRADNALYEGKRAGRNRVIVWTEKPASSAS